MYPAWETPGMYLEIYLAERLSILSCLGAFLLVIYQNGIRILHAGFFLGILLLFINLFYLIKSYGVYRLYWTKKIFAIPIPLVTLYADADRNKSARIFFGFI